MIRTADSQKNPRNERALRGVNERTTVKLTNLGTLKEPIENSAHFWNFVYSQHRNLCIFCGLTSTFHHDDLWSINVAMRMQKENICLIAVFTRLFTLSSALLSFRWFGAWCTIVMRMHYWGILRVVGKGSLSWDRLSKNRTSWRQLCINES